MIIDIHSHVCAAPQLYRFKANLLASRGQPPHGFALEPFSDEFVRDHPVRVVEAWAIANHDYIAQQVRLFPTRLQGVCGLPQVRNEPVNVGFPELDRCVKDLGFVGRWQADWVLHGGGKSIDVFNQRLRKLYFDTCLHYKKSLELLIGLVGPKNVLFGTENPGSGSALNPETGRNFDDIKPLIEEIEFLTAEDRQNIFEDNARRLFTRFTRLPR